MQVKNGKAKHVLLAERLRESILQGELSPGDRLPSQTQMLEKYGLSRPTVERAHSLLQQEGLIVLEQRRGAFVARPQQARTMTGIIGITGLDHAIMSTPHDGAFIGAVKAAAAREGWEVLLLNRTSEIRREKVDGVLNQEPVLEYVVHRLPPGIPFVSTLIPIRGMNCVIADETDGIRASVEHLYDLGHRRIAYLVETTHGTQRISDRVRAFKDTVLALGLEFNERLIRELETAPSLISPYREGGKDSMRRWLDDDWSNLGCTGLLVQNDDSAVGAIETLVEAGVRVPQDVSVIGFDGAGVGDYFSPKLTTVEVPLREIGQLAVEVLLKQIRGEGGSLPVALTLPTRLKIGESTGAL